MNVGASRQEILEIVLQMAVYAGFCAALNGPFTAKDGSQERETDTSKRSDRSQSQST